MACNRHHYPPPFHYIATTLITTLLHCSHLCFPHSFKQSNPHTTFKKPQQDQTGYKPQMAAPTSSAEAFHHGPALSNNEVPGGNVVEGANPESLFGNTTHNPWVAHGGLSGPSQAQPNMPGGIFTYPQPNIATGGLFGSVNQNQQQSSSSLFGKPQNTTTHTHGPFGSVSSQSGRPFSFFDKPQNAAIGAHESFGSIPAQPGIPNSLFDNKPNPPTGGLFGSNNQTQPRTSSSLFGANCSTFPNRDNSKNGGLFGRNQEQNRSHDLFGNPISHVNTFGQPNPPSTFNRTSAPLGGFNTPADNWASAWMRNPAQNAPNFSPFSNVQPRNESGFKNSYSVHRPGTVPCPGTVSVSNAGTFAAAYTPYIEREANGQKCIYSHISVADQFRNWSNEELRLADYHNGYQFGPLRAHAVEENKTTDKMTTMMQKFVDKLSILEAEIKSLKIEKGTNRPSLPPTRLAMPTAYHLFDQAKEKTKEEADGEEKDISAASTPVHILTPTSSASTSPTRTPEVAAATTAEADDFIKIHSPNAPEQPTNTSCSCNATSSLHVNPSSTTTTQPPRKFNWSLSVDAYLLLAWIDNNCSRPNSVFGLFEPKMRQNVNLSETEYYAAAAELVRERLVCCIDEGLTFKRNEDLSS